MTEPDGTIDIAYDIDALPDPEYDPDLIAQAESEADPAGVEYPPSASDPQSSGATPAR